MDKLLKKLGFEEKKYDWFSFDNSIKKVILLKAAIAFLLLVVSIFLFVAGTARDGFITLAIFVIFSGYVYYQYLYFCYEKFEFVIANCVSIDRKINELFKRRYYDKCTMTLVADGNYYIMNINPRVEVKNGSKVIVYMSKNSLSEINENTYAIDNPITFTVLSHPTEE